MDGIDQETDQKLKTISAKILKKKGKKVGLSWGVTVLVAMVFYGLYGYEFLQNALWIALWISMGTSVWLLFDFALVWWRQEKGYYGPNKLETREIINEIKASGGKPS